MLCVQILKWNFTAPRPEHLDQLKEQLTPCVSKKQFTEMFHADFKHHIVALDALLKVGFDVHPRITFSSVCDSVFCSIWQRCVSDYRCVLHALSLFCALESIDHRVVAF